MWVLLVAIGCYNAPDYDGTHFKCDDNHGCPDGQQCVNGICGGMDGGSGSNMIDAPQTAIGVKCGATTCASNQKCCADFINGVSCIALTATCNGFSATCDGKEDCSGGPCCENGSTIACGTTCVNATICTDTADCPAQTPLCCTIPQTNEPWGRCYTTCP